MKVNPGSSPRSFRQFQGALRHERACAPGFASRENFAQVARGS